MIGRLFKLVLLLAVLAVAGLAVFAYLGDLAPPPGEETLGITLDAD